MIYDDIRFTNMQLSRSLFGFIVCRPKLRSAIAAETLERWTREEHEREAKAMLNGGRYYLPTELEVQFYGEPADTGA